MEKSVTRSLPAPCRAVSARAAPWLLAAAALSPAWSVQAAEPAKPGAASQAGSKPPANPAPRPAPRAAAKPVAAPLVPGKPIEPLLTRDELRACMARQDKLRADGAEASRLQQALEQEKEGILREGEALKTELPTLDRSSPPAVEAYNARVKARDDRITAFEPQIAAFNASVGTLESDRAAYARDCVNRKFDEKDEEALKKAR